MSIILLSPEVNVSEGSHISVLMCTSSFSSIMFVSPPNILRCQRYMPYCAYKAAGYICLIGAILQHVAYILCLYHSTMYALFRV